MRDEPRIVCRFSAGAASPPLKPLYILYAWAQEVLSKEGHGDWRITGTAAGGGLCIHKTKQILIDELHDQDPFMYLHEIAHVEHPNHSGAWVDHFTALCLRYIGPVISELAAAQREIEELRAQLASIRLGTMGYFEVPGDGGDGQAAGTSGESGSGGGYPRQRIK